MRSLMTTHFQRLEEACKRLELAIASGHLEVEYDNQRVRYHSVQQMRAALSATRRRLKRLGPVRLCRAVAHAEYPGRSR